MDKAPTVHRTIREQVATHLRHAVLSGEFGVPPGARVGVVVSGGNVAASTLAALLGE